MVTEPGRIGGWQGAVKIVVSFGLDYVRWTQLVPMITAWTFLIVLVVAMVVVNFQGNVDAMLQRVEPAVERVLGPADEGEPAEPGIELALDPGAAEGGAAEDQELGAAPAEGPEPGEPGALPTLEAPGAQEPAGPQEQASAQEPAAGQPPADRPEWLTEAEQGAPPERTRITQDDVLPWAFRIWMGLALVGWLLGAIRTHLYGPRPPRPLLRKLMVPGVGAVAASALMFLSYFLGQTPFQGGFLGWFLLFTLFPLGVWIVSAWSISISHLIGRIQRALDRSFTGVNVRSPGEHAGAAGAGTGGSEAPPRA